MLRSASSPGAARGACRSLLVALMLLPASCVDVSGGAVEARWDLRNENGDRIDDCATTPIATLRFGLAPSAGGADPCATDPGCRFACSLKSGATAFMVPEGDYTITLEALSGDGQPLGPPGVVVPEPVSRHVVHGRVTDLDVNLIIVTPGSG
jgi:hypothetical protein